MGNTTEKSTIPFMAHRKKAAVFSVLLVIASIVSLSTRGLEFGLDFTGGTLVEVAYETPANLEAVRQLLSVAGYQGAVVVYYGSERDVLIRLQQGNSPDLGQQVMQVLRQGSDTAIDLRRIEFVGPQVGEELKDDGGLALLMALAMVMLYVAFRFQFKFAVGAVAALVHDVIITLGFFSVLGLGFDLTVLAALLAVIGYSLNDTIVVSDRIRENFRGLRKVDPLSVIDISLTQTFGRTLITSLTTLLVLTALFVFGGELIHGFASALLVGVTVGTYSSIYIAANTLLMMQITKEDLIVPIKEGQDDEPFDARP